jgi:hypothetical protein
MVATCALPWNALAEPFYGADVRYAHDDNLTLAAAPADRLGHNFVDVGAHAGRFVALAHDDSVSLQAGLRAARYARYTSLDSASLEAASTYRAKLGIGLTAPWLSIGLAAAHDDFRDDIRDSDRAEVRVAAGARLSQQFDVSAGYAHDRRLARHADPAVPGISGAIYDGIGDSAFLRAGYAFTDRVLVDVEWRLRRGDAVATTPASAPIFFASSAIAEDPAFGPERYGYRLRGTTTGASVALSYAIDDRSALNLAYRAEWTRAAAALDYRSRVLSAAYLWRY